jgi:hypothetical protein
VDYEGTASPASTTHVLECMEVLPDGLVRVNFPVADANGRPVELNALDGAPVLWRATPGGWSAALEHGTPSDTQTKVLEVLGPPFVTDDLPARPVHVGERTDLRVVWLKPRAVQVCSDLCSNLGSVRANDITLSYFASSRTVLQSG